MRRLINIATRAALALAIVLSPAIPTLAADVTDGVPAGTCGLTSDNHVVCNDTGWVRTFEGDELTPVVVVIDDTDRVRQYQADSDDQDEAPIEISARTITNPAVAAPAQTAPMTRQAAQAAAPVLPRGFSAGVYPL